jgi:hypothetical protein
MNTYITRDPYLFNNSAEAEWKNYYDSYSNLGKIQFLIHEVGESYLSLPFTTARSSAVCSGLAFVGGFSYSGFSKSSIHEQLRNCLGYLPKVGISHVVHKELPTFYGVHTGYSKWTFENSVNSQANTGETSIVYREDIKFAGNRRRLISRYSNNFEIRQLLSYDEIKKYWDFLFASLSNKNLGTLPLERIFFLTTSLGNRYKLFGVEDKNKRIIGTVLVDNYLDVSRFVNYFFQKNNDSRGAFETFLNTYLKSEVNKFKIIDFGSSANPNTGQIVESILHFKQSFNTHQVPTFRREYQLEGL